MTRDTLNYRKLTDKPKGKEPEEEENANEEKMDEGPDFVALAQGINE